MKTRSERPSVEEATGTFAPGCQTALFYGLAIIGALFLEFVLFRISQSNSSWLGDVAQILMVVFGLLAYLVIDIGGKSIRKREQEAAQRIRDANARKVYEELLGNGSTDTAVPERLRNTYFLYLRPFVSTGKVKIVLKSGMTKRGVLATTTTTIDYPGYGRTSLYKRYVNWGDLETELAAALESYGPLIALGKPGEQIGSGRIQSTEETWRADFFRLAKGARLIFLLPSTHEGTKWEIERILENHHLIRKCIFIVPPDEDLFGAPMTLGSTFKFGSKPQVSNDAALRADAIQAVRLFNLKKRTIRAIKNEPNGLMFILGGDRSILASRQLLVYTEPLISLSPTYFDVKELSRTDFSEAIYELSEYSDSRLSAA